MHVLIRVHVIWEGLVNFFYLQMVVHNLSVHSWAITVTVMCAISCAYMYALMLPPRSQPFNCSAPDTGNMEVLVQYGSEQQKVRQICSDFYL